MGFWRRWGARRIAPRLSRSIAASVDLGGRCEIYWKAERRKAAGYFFMPGYPCELRCRHRLASRRRRRVDDSEPILPRRAESGSTARKRSRMSDAALSPLAANSRSPAAICWSKPATRWWSWVLMPQRRKSPNGGRRRSRATGAFLAQPSAAASTSRECGSRVAKKAQRHASDGDGFLEVDRHCRPVLAAVWEVGQRLAFDPLVGPDLLDFNIEGDAPNGPNRCGLSSSGACARRCPSRGGQTADG